MSRTRSLGWTLRRGGLYGLGLIALELLGLCALGWAQSYVLTDLGPDVRVNGLNDRGEISGVDGQGQVVVRRNGQWQVRPPCVGGITNEGWLAGQVANQNSTPCVANSSLRTLLLPSDVPFGGAATRLGNGVIFGSGAEQGTFRTVPLRWRNQNAMAVKLPTLGGAAYVIDANQSQLAVGLAQKPGSIYATYWPVLWYENAIYELPVWEDTLYVDVRALNNDHLICGSMVRPSGLPRPNEIEYIPVLWDIYGRIYELPRLPGYLHAWATAIADPQNDLARVVGTAMVRDDSLIPPPVAVMWGPETGRQEAVPLQSLVTNTPGWTFERPIAVNSVGQILGSNGTGAAYRAWLLTPVAQVAGR